MSSRQSKSSPGRPRNRKAGGGSAGSRAGGRELLRKGLIGLIVTSLVVVGIFFFAYQRTEIPDPNAAYQSQSSYIYYANGKAKLGQFADQNRESIALADIPQVMQDAAIAAEDRTFWTNRGIDPKGILRAAFSNAQGNATQGASTITQQYVKILYLSQERTFKRKVKEAFLSLKVQQQQSKQQILEGYLNTVYFGRGAYGVQAAANAFFGIPAKQLNAGQSAMLAAVLNSPNYLSPDRNEAARAALLARYKYVLNGMAEAGSISSAEVEKFSAALPKTKAPNTSNQFGGQRGFMLSMVKDELRRRGFEDSEIEGGGLRVTTTFNRTAMAAARDAVLQEKPEGLTQLHAAVASVDVKTGGLLGFYGGQDFLQSQINWAKTPDSTGSAFKPFALAAGLEEGFSLKDTFDGNSPYEFPDGSDVVNEGEGTGENFGRVSLTKATTASINTAYVDLTQAIPGGPRKIATVAEKAGVPKIADNYVNARISLGSQEVSPIDMANAYATIANEGRHHDWHVIKRVVRASDGQVLYEAKPKNDRAMDSDIASDVTYAMEQNVQSGTGRKAQRIGRPAAGKTGTATDDNGNVITSWFVGYTPQVSTAVMYVRGNGRKALNDYLPSYFGADYPTATWAAAMGDIMGEYDEEDFPSPAFVDGEAPTNGHAPYTPPPPPPKPKPKPKPKPQPKPTPTPTPPPSTPPTPPPTGGGGTGGNGGNGGHGGPILFNRRF